jgi:GntR family transcriptional regulator
VAVPASREEANELDVAEATPLLKVERLAYDILGRAIERRRSLYRTDTLAYMVTLD